MRSTYRAVATQDEKPVNSITLDKVGIEGLKTSVDLSTNGSISTCPLTVGIMIDLARSRKGIHMSRLVESMNEAVSTRTREIERSFEELGRSIIEELAGRHPFSKAEVTMETILMIARRTPVTKKRTDEPYEVKIRVIKENGGYKKHLQVKVVGSTLCPHSLKMTKGRSHIQRAEIEADVYTDLETPLPLEELVDVAESALSSPSYTVLKSPDEAYLVHQMFSNPKFVEDVVRDCFVGLKRLQIKGRARVKAVAYESIHKHNAVSELERELNGLEGREMRRPP